MALLRRQFSTMMWKIWLIRKRHYVETGFLALSPLLITSFIVYLLGRVSAETAKGGDSKPFKVPATIYDPSFDLFKDVTMKLDIFYHPDNPDTQLLIGEMKKIYGSLTTSQNSVNSINFTGFNFEDSIDASMETELKLQANTSYHEYVGFIFEGDVTTTDFSYRIFTSEPTPDSRKPFPTTDKASASAVQGLRYPKGFVSGQIVVNEAYLNLLALKKNHQRVITRDLVLQKFPYPSYTDPNLPDYIPRFKFLGTIIITSFALLFMNVVKDLCKEKTNKSKELFAMMGLSDWVYWSSTFAAYFLLFSVQVFLILLIIYTNLGYDGATVITYSNASVIYLAFSLFGANLIVFAMFLSIFISSPKYAGTVSMFTFIFCNSGGSRIRDLFDEDTGKKSVLATIVFSMLPTLGMDSSLEIIHKFENLGEGSTYGNLFDYVYPYSDISLGAVMICMLFSCLFWSFMIWYVDNVWPWQNGVPKAPWFPCTQDYWTTKADYSQYTKADRDPKYFEAEPTNVSPAVELVNVQKKFGNKFAVKNVDLDIYPGQITVLLGHNGAGKTTTMSMMTALLTPTSGKIRVNGFDVVTQTKQARQSIGLCPQTNVLYEDLNCEEHLILYGGIKGFPSDQIDEEVTDVLAKVQLSEKRRTMSSNLSGGMKRKLNLGIAMVGGTEILVLDEPTSGLDPEARRHLWDVLLNIRKQRTILLTTHEMEEADALGDKLAIMDAGEVKCYGSSLFLKRAFGSGYILHVAKSTNHQKEALKEIIIAVFPNASVEREMDSQVEYVLAGNGQEVDRSKFPAFFKQLEDRKNSIGIASFGVTISTMEDVFLKVASLSQDKSENIPPEVDQDSAATPLNQGPNQSVERRHGCALWLIQLYGLLAKRIMYFVRSPPILNLIGPALWFIFAWWIVNILLSIDMIQHPKKFSLGDTYGPTEVFLLEDSSSGANTPLQPHYSSVTLIEKGVLTVLSDISININDYLLELADENRVTYKAKHVVGAKVKNLIGNGRSYELWYSDEAYHSIPETISLLYDALLSEVVGSPSTVNVTFVPPNEDKSYFFSAQATLIASFFLLPFFATISASYGSHFVIFPSLENTSQAKLVQYMTGLSPVIYWLSNFMFDFLVLLMVMAFMLIVLYFCDSRQVFTAESTVLFAFILLLLLCGIAFILIAYFISIYLSAETNGEITLIQAYSYSTLLFGFSFYLVDSLRLYSDTLMLIHTYAGFILKFSPAFSLSYGSVKLFRYSSVTRTCDLVPTAVLDRICDPSSFNLKEFFGVGCCPEKCQELATYFAQATNSESLEEDFGDEFCYNYKDPFALRNTGILQELLSIAFLIVALLSLIIFVESLSGKKFFRYIRYRLGHRRNLNSNSIQDSDVHEEQLRVSQAIESGDFQDTLIVSSLFKKFGKFVVVNELSFGVHPGECFGVLGINGAGKTTTFRMVTGDILPDAGRALMGPDNSTENNVKSYQKRIGYCPQFNPLLDKLTGKETLCLMGRLRGFSGPHLENLVNELVRMVDLEEHMNKQTHAYSGGNKRKLTVAMALVSAPDLLILDEPTSGVDPGARRKIWSTLAEVKQKYGCSIILTSHSMDECEALCARIGIMVKGQFKCLGTLQHLRNKFAQGFSLTLKLKRSKTDAEPALAALVVQDVQVAIPSSYVKDQHETLIYFHVRDTNEKWSRMFEVMESLTKKYDLEDYSLSDTTLEQIFVSFAKNQQEADLARVQVV
ncbi:Phospholipid-transporting ATPase ABCA3 [Halotydeus destructor]|nr:Phospholipid-transporting ATPase ABCA3 [Halotydeus destructor]